MRAGVLFLISALWVIVTLWAVPIFSRESPERAAAILRAEMAIEMDLTWKSPQLFPVPVLPGEPKIDGAVDDDFWKEATTVLWEDPEGAPFRFAPGWLFYFAWTEGGLFLAGTRMARTEETEVLLIPLQSEKSLVLNLAASGPSTASFGGRAARSFEEDGGRFATRRSREGLTFELSLPRGTAFWPDGPDPMRIPWISSMRGNPPEVRLSPVFQMARAEKSIHWTPPRAPAGGKTGPLEPEEVRLRKRLEHRQSFISSLPAALDKVLLVKGRPGVTAGRLCIVSLWSGEEREIVLLPAGSAARDPCLSPAGDEVVFALEQGTEGTHLQIVSLAGGSPRVLTPLDGSRDVQPCWTSSGEIVFVSDRAKKVSPFAGRISTLHAVREDGGELRRVSFNPHGDAAPALLPDGRVAFQRWVEAPLSRDVRSVIWVMNPDGSHLSALELLDGYDYDSLLVPRPVPGTRWLSCIREGGRPFNGSTFGAITNGLLVIDLAKGGKRSETGLTLGRREIAEAVPLGPGTFLGIAHLARAGWGLYVFDTQGKSERVGGDLDHSFSHPIPLLPRPRAQSLSPVRPFGSDPAAQMATLVVVDVRRGLPKKDPNAVRWIRVFSVPDGTEGDRRADMQPMSLGRAPVHPDGSAHFRVPSRVALRLAVVDEAGREISSMQNPISFAPGEHRSCIGCHEDRALAPPPGTRGRLMALDGPAASLTPDSPAEREGK